MIDILYLEQASGASLAQALANWRADGRPFHVLALVPEDEAGEVETLQAACRESGIALAGAVFPELLVDGQLRRRGLVLVRILGTTRPLLLDAVSSPAAVERVAAALADYVETGLAPDEEGALFCIFDALVPNIATHLDAWYLTLADRVHYLGVNGGSERFVSIPCLFDGERCIADGVLVQLLPGHPGACLEHGYAVPDRVITATSAQGNRIVQIDWRPALDVYRDLMQEQYGVSIDRDNFYAYAVHFPFGILRADGEVLVRIPVALDDEGGIVCVGEIPPNSVLTLLDARAGSGQAASTLANDLRGLAPTEGKPLLLFYCAGRRMHMGPERMADELQRLDRECGSGACLGALSLGEIGASRNGGYPLFHNATLVGIPWLPR